MPIGFNQAWFKNNYGSQYMNSSFDEQEVKRVFKLASLSKAHTLRLWFFESNELPMIEFQGNTPTHLKSEYIKNVIKTLKIAESYKIKVYMTLFDAHMYNPIKFSKDKFLRFKALFTKSNGDSFLKNILTPLLKKIEEENLSHVIDKIDLTNEMDAVIHRLGFKRGWRGAKRMLCQWRSSIQSNTGFTKTPVTFSVRLHPLVNLPHNLLKDDGPLKCADFIDLHSYHNKGKIYRCNLVKRYTKKNKKKVILGEFGQGFFNRRCDDNLQSNNTKDYIKSAQKCGFTEALAWRLSDIRPGENKEARYSFEAYGKPRPAFYIIKDHNENQKDK